MISFVYITTRYEPHVEWFLDSLRAQLWPGEDPQIIIVAPEHSRVPVSMNFQIVRPKPTIWAGPARITQADWWAAANARNTGICYAQEKWIAFVDDRSVLLPGWMDCVREAMKANCMVCGTYQKVHDMVVERGVAQKYTSFPGFDNRLDYVQKHWAGLYNSRGPFDCPGEWTYGCALVLPLEWALSVGGFDETCDGLGMEDGIFGLMLQNRRYHITFDPRMGMLEDRTIGECGPVPLRRDKGISPNDKSHAMLEKLRVLKQALLPGNLRNIRNEVLKGAPFPAPSAPQVDWYDGEKISLMK